MDETGLVFGIPELLQNVRRDPPVAAEGVAADHLFSVV
jgi:hypothetical protein